MSGGSFDYLCHKDADDFVAYVPESMERMADALLEYGTPEATAAAYETRVLISRMKNWQQVAEVHMKLLRPVWKAVEWHHSSDWSKDQVHEALGAYVDGP